MCGIDWNGVLDQYRPLVERVASPDDFADLLREVLGELGILARPTSPPVLAATRALPHYQRRQGLLGANFVRQGGEVGRWPASSPASPRTPRPAPRWPAPASARARS
ncbi:hypothetical protein ACRAWF_46925 [Streptomyces sp. L7]